MRALVPFTGFTGLRREMDRLFDRFLEGETMELPAFGEWMPKVDVSENKDQVTVKADVPGIDAKKLDVSVEDDVLTIRGEKTEEKEEKGEHTHRRERSYGAFVRSVRLPGPVDATKAEATFKDGVVTVKLAKAARAKGTTIAVKAAA
jgi:HSP20 family protein